jgi:hypothetical protein
MPLQACRWIVQSILFVMVLFAMFGPHMTWRYFLAHRIASRLGVSSFFELNVLVALFMLSISFFVFRWTNHSLL